jgi:H+/gluconate symporter-like permease
MNMPNRQIPKPSNYQFIKSIVFDVDILTIGIRINIAVILFVTLLWLSNYWKRNEEVSPTAKSIHQTSQSSHQSMSKRDPR